MFISSIASFVVLHAHFQANADNGPSIHASLHPCWFSYTASSFAKSSLLLLISREYGLAVLCLSSKRLLRYYFQESQFLQSSERLQRLADVFPDRKLFFQDGSDCSKAVDNGACRGRISPSGSWLSTCVHAQAAHVVSSASLNGFLHLTEEECNHASHTDFEMWSCCPHR
jgi:hypothetical protein